jgi:hypothetical protein
MCSVDDKWLDSGLPVCPKARWPLMRATGPAPKQPRPQPLLRVNLTSADVSPQPARTPSADRSPHSPSPRIAVPLRPAASPRAEVSPRPEGKPSAEPSPRSEPLSRSQSSPRKELTPNMLRRRIASLQPKPPVLHQRNYRARLSAEEKGKPRSTPPVEATEKEGTVASSAEMEKPSPRFVPKKSPRTPTERSPRIVPGPKGPGHAAEETASQGTIAPGGGGVATSHLRALPTIPSAQAVAMTTSEPTPGKPGTSDVLS